MKKTTFIPSFIKENEKVLQFIKFCLVGVLNTVVCMGAIYICNSFLRMGPYISNFLGYVAGMVNSFLCNKQWVFQSDGGYIREGIKFIIGWGLCYGIQFLVMWTVNTSLGPVEYHYRDITISGYGVATLVGMCSYTFCNYIYNRLVTFRK